MILYRIIIQPIEYIIEILYTLLYRFFESPGTGLIALSVVVSLLLLPLYLRSDAIAAAEREKQESMQAWLTHIRQHFKKDERAMMQAEYYAIMHYHPIQSLKGVLSLLLQIPFFIAAYHFLSGLQLLKDCPFGPIKDLSAPDGLLGSHLNLLPLLMTLINLISTFVYTKGFPFKEKLSPLLLSLAFLLLLYDRPSGLVLYWTMNNLFSLGKNLAVKYVKNRRALLAGLFTAMDLVFITRILRGRRIAAHLSEGDREWVFYVGLTALLLLLPLMSLILKRPRRLPAGGALHAGEDRKLAYTICRNALALALFQGMVVPLSVISASPEEFINPFYFRTPLYYVYCCACVAFGLYLFWGNVIAFLLPLSGRRTYAFLQIVLLAIMLPNHFFYKPENVDTLSIYLQWLPAWPHYGTKTRLLNLLLLLLIVFILVLLKKKKERILGHVTRLILLILCGISLYQLYQTQGKLAKVQPDESLMAEERDFVLSSGGRNVVLIMLDRAIGTYIPYIFNEYPMLAEAYDGFTFYPNTLSMGLMTRFGSPELFGGYEYTPAAINARPDALLKDKHNEAISLLPRVFGEQGGFSVTICDIPMANYSWLSDLHIYDDYDYINAFHLSRSLQGGLSWEESRAVMERNFWMYALYKSAPLMLQDEIYDYGNYLSPDAYADALSNVSYVRNKAALEYFATQTKIEEAAEDRLILFVNNTTHDPIFLSEEEVGSGGNFPATIDGRTITEGNEEGGRIHYQANVSALMSLAKWLTRLKEAGAYDNTRIIITSDHGRSIEQFADMLLFDGAVDVEAVNALLLFKDFDVRGEVQTDTRFMTNADAPTLAVQGLIEHAQNPYSGVPISSEEKEKGVDVLYSEAWNYEGSNLFDPPDASWYHVSPGDIADDKNWTEIR